VSVLIVAAHPDDEALGCGATAASLAASGPSVCACFLSGRAAARGKRASDLERVANCRAAPGVDRWQLLRMRRRVVRFCLADLQLQRQLCR
jgi:LmbE family N-acetylglucosaminyl deacetylase